LNLASWPLFYLLLQSYVAEWPGVMCIYGVTQIGAGSLGPSRFLPGLLATLQVVKPALVFVTGTWFVLYALNRRTPTAPLTSRVLLAAVVLGLFAVFDSAAEAAYLVIPKKEEFLSSGCCTLAFDTPSGASSVVSGILANPDYRPWLYGAYYGVNVGMVLALAGCIRGPEWRRTGTRLALLGVGALVSWPVNLLFLIGIAAPALLGLAHHHCPYDLVPAVPESVVALGLFAAGSFCVGWACVAAWFGDCPETRPYLGQEVGRILRLGLWGYAGSVVMLSFELALA
jgi:hypothetical protein